MNRNVIRFTPFQDQKAGTSGLRKKTAEFQRPHYLESYVQAIFDSLGGAQGKTFALGGDGRYFCTEACQVIIKMAAAQQAERLIVGQNGLFSTPALSHQVRLRDCDGGFVLSASHNPGGAQGDFGVKFNVKGGGASPDQLNAKVYERSKELSAYSLLDCKDIDLSQPARLQLMQTKIEVVDPVQDYLELMEQIFDFEQLSALFANGFHLQYDAMSAVTGPYAQAIFEQRLGARKGSVINARPLPDFGGGHPDPNPLWAKELMSIMMDAQGNQARPDLGAASDGDGDRYMILGKDCYINPSDSLAFIAANADCLPYYRDKLSGFARSMPTSRALDAVAKARNLPCYETPTGWKFFASLLEAGKISICGEESFGSSSLHVREKDGIWAVLMWLSIIAHQRQQPKQQQIQVADLIKQHWQRYGRHYYSRHDYEEINAASAAEMMARLQGLMPQLIGQSYAGFLVESCDNFSYQDPIDQSISENQGLRIFFDQGARIVLRLSGTGTKGATLRLYLERYHASIIDDESLLAPLVQAAEELVQIKAYTQKSKADVIT